MPSAQQRFDEAYITSSEICRSFGVSRPTVHKRRLRGLLPDGIVVNCLYVWERAAIAEALERWKRERSERDETAPA